MHGQERYGLILLAGAFLSAALLVPITTVWAIPESVRIPVVEDHQGDPPDAALFSHGRHSQYKCYSCHWSIFPQYPEGFTHEDMDAGRYCGACHNGFVAWAVDDDEVDCEICHVAGSPAKAPQAEAPEAAQPTTLEPPTEAEPAPEPQEAAPPESEIDNDTPESAADTDEDGGVDTENVSPDQEE